jgi:hypothetical protein
MSHPPIASAAGRRAALGLSALALALAAASAMAASTPARAATASAWTAYPSMSACKTGLVSVPGAGLASNDACFGLTGNGGALGLVDPGLPADEHDQAAGVPYDDERLLPPPEGPGHQVDEVWNNSGIELLIAGGTSSLATDAAASQPIYGVAPGADQDGPPLDADQGYSQQYHYNSYSNLPG